MQWCPISGCSNEAAPPASPRRRRSLDCCHRNGDHGNVSIQAAIVHQESASIFHLFNCLWDALLAYKRLCCLQQGDSIRVQAPTVEDSYRILDLSNSAMQQGG